ncbi:hypothetical protein [Mesorhizobium amorphae]|uniref:hypothetical protein n=1 Tax=Mesorhizobium amorphae TaxID=71433 RepID=UPI001186C3ED|nr:hypothetical protein [Mesorhizobium amorphae]
MSKLSPAILAALAVVFSLPANADPACKQLPFQQTGVLGRTTLVEGDRPSFGTWGSWMKSPVDRAGTLRVSLQPELDPNHVDGFGSLQLVAYVYLFEEMDLRNATLKFDIKGRDFVANDANLYAWVQGCRVGGKYGDSAGACANWAFSSAPLTSLVESGSLESVELKLVDDESKWSYGGNNAEQGSAASRYRYQPLAKVLAHPINLHFVLAIPVGGMPASGGINLSNVSICPSEKKVDDDFGRSVISAQRDGYDLSVRVMAQGERSNLAVWANDERVISIYAGNTNHGRDIFLRNTQIPLCADVYARISNINGSQTVEIKRNETLWQKTKRVFWCMKPKGRVVASVDH